MRDRIKRSMLRRRRKLFLRASRAARNEICFDSYRFDPESGELRRGRLPIQLRPQATRALRLLLSRSNRLVTQEELRREIWGDTIVEWDTGLHQVMCQLRRALQDDPKDPAYIETVARRGYRFKHNLGVPAGSAARNDSLPRSRLRDALLVLSGVLAPPLLLVLICFLLGFE